MMNRRKAFDLSVPGRILSRLLVIWALVLPAIATSAGENRGQRAEAAAQGLAQAALMGPADHVTPQRAKAAPTYADDATPVVRTVPLAFVPARVAMVLPAHDHRSLGRVAATALPRGPPAV